MTLIGLASLHMWSQPICGDWVWEASRRIKIPAVLYRLRAVSVLYPKFREGQSIINRISHPRNIPTNS